MEKSNLYNHLQRLFDEGFFRKDACQWVEIAEETLSKVA